MIVVGENLLFIVYGMGDILVGEFIMYYNRNVLILEKYDIF